MAWLISTLVLLVLVSSPTHELLTCVTYLQVSSGTTHPCSNSSSYKWAIESLFAGWKNKYVIIQSIAIMASYDVWLFAFGQVVDWRVHFCTVITFVGGPRGPVPTELALGFTASQPVESHVHWFNATRDNGLVDNSHCCGVVSLDRQMRLWLSHFN